MAIANGTFFCFCNQPKTHFILASLGIRPWDYRGKCHMDDNSMIQCLSDALQHVPIYLQDFNRFPVIQPVSSKVRHFSTYFAHFGLPEYAPGTIAPAVNVTRMEWKEDTMLQVKRMTAYPSIFNRLQANVRCEMYVR